MKIINVLIFTLLFTLHFLAQDVPGTKPAAAQQQKGDKELQISANMSFTRGGAATPW